jgi:two-component system, sensor histidine kinase
MNPQTKPPLVLEVSDSRATLALVAGVLRDENMEVLQARDGASALVIARQSMPDVVLLDMALSGVDGHEITRRLRADEATAAIPIVHTSVARATAQARQSSFESGADAYLEPLFAARELVAVVGSLARLRQAAVAALRRAEALHADNQKKDEFIAMLGHEMRNPLGAARVGLSLLENCRADEERAGVVRATISRQIDSLVRLADDLLDVARIAQGKLRLDAAPVDLCHVVASSVEVARSSFERHGVGLAVETGFASIVVDGDATRLDQIVGNLLDNALKYTPSGGQVKVTVSVVKEAPARARLSVKDSGVGIDKKHLDGGLFMLFFQGDTSLARREGGLGIGLTIVHRLVETHGGTVRVSSDGPGLGAEFIIELPLLPALVRPVPASKL